MMHDDIMHDGIWCIDTLPFQYTTQKKKKYQNSIEYFLLGKKNDFTNNYPVFTHMHTFSLLGRMPLTSRRY
jgi:hypothetical protein